ncbi:hypothetical protein R3I94_002347 [Phoxinus phoxinus]
MLFADDVVISDEDREELERRLEIWREKLEGAGLKLSRSKTEHLPPTGREESIRLREYDSTAHANLPQHTAFKYLGTTIHQDGGCRKERVLSVAISSSLHKSKPTRVGSNTPALARGAFATSAGL